jgi:hypothetical protein
MVGCGNVDPAVFPYVLYRKALAIIDKGMFEK